MRQLKAGENYKINMKNIGRYWGNEIMKKKRILILSSSFPRFSGDFAGNFVYELAKRLKDYCLDIIIVAPHDKIARFQEDMNGLKVYRFPYFFPCRLQKLAYGDGISYNVKKSFLVKLQIPLFFLFELIKVLKIVKRERIDIINSHWLFPQGLVGAICKRFLGISHIATLHSSEITLLKKFPAGRKITEFIIKNTDVVTSVSYHRADELSKFMFDKEVMTKIKIVPMGVTVENIVDKNKNQLRIKYNVNQKIIILFVGRLVDVKGCEYLIESFKLIVDKFNDIQLIIVGNGPLEAKLKRMVEEFDLKENIRFEGFVERNKISDYYNLSDIIVIPSIVDSSGYEEGLPVVLLEALIFGRPIVATRTKGIMEIIKDSYNGILVEPKSSKQIANSILMLINNHQLRYKLSEAALKCSENYGWDVVANKYFEMIKNVGCGKI